MKSFLAGCGAVVLLIVVVWVVVLFWAFHRGASEQDAFYKAVDTGDVNQVMALLAPELQQEIDAPVLAEWVKAMQARLGKCQGLRAMDFSTSTQIENGVKVTESKGTVRFEKGDAQSELVLRDGKITQFHVQSDKLADWFTELSDTALYEKQAEDCLTKIMTGKIDEARGMMHEELQKILTAEQLQSFLDSALPESGALKELKLDSKAFQAGNPAELELKYTIVCEKKPMHATMGFQFVDLKGYLVSVSISPPES